MPGPEGDDLEAAFDARAAALGLALSASEREAALGIAKGLRDGASRVREWLAREAAE